MRRHLGNEALLSIVEVQNFAGMACSDCEIAGRPFRPLPPTLRLPRLSAADEALLCSTLQAVDAELTAEVLAGRAAVHNKLNNHMEAAADASRAVELDGSLAAAHREKGWVSFA